MGTLIRKPRQICLHTMSLMSFGVLHSAPNNMILVFSFPKVLLNMEIIKRNTVH